MEPPGRSCVSLVDDSSVDLVVSGLVLNFVPNQGTALAEMARVTGHGGTIAAYIRQRIPVNADGAIQIGIPTS